MNMPLMGALGPLTDQIRKIIQDEDKSDEIIRLVIESNRKLQVQTQMITKLVAMISKMYHDGEINKETFNKLDVFLKPYYENPYDGNF